MYAHPLSWQVNTPGGQLIAPTRTVHNRHGLRIIVQQTGRVGRFDFQVGGCRAHAVAGVCHAAMLLTLSRSCC